MLCVVNVSEVKQLIPQYQSQLSSASSDVAKAGAAIALECAETYQSYRINQPSSFK